MPVTTAEIGEARAVASGALSAAILGTALPTNASTALIAAFKPYGYIGNDGIAQARELATDEVRDMNGDLVYMLNTGVTKTYQAELLQYDNVDLKKDIYGTANVVTTVADPTNGFRIAVTDKGDPAAHVILSIDTFRIGPTGRTEKSRIVVPDAQPTTIEIGPLRAGAVRSYTVTWSVYKTAAGVFAFEYDDDGVTNP